MQLFRNNALSAPISFFDLASLRQAVRLACFFAAASLVAVAAGVIVDGFAAAEIAGGAPAACADGAAVKAATAAKTLRHTAVATVEKIRIQLPCTRNRRQEPMAARIASRVSRTDEAGMKLA